MPEHINSTCVCKGPRCESDRSLARAEFGVSFPSTRVANLSFVLPRSVRKATTTTLSPAARELVRINSAPRPETARPPDTAQRRSVDHHTATARVASTAEPGTFAFEPRCQSSWSSSHLLWTVSRQSGTVVWERSRRRRNDSSYLRFLRSTRLCTNEQRWTATLPLAPRSAVSSRSLVPSQQCPSPVVPLRNNVAPSAKVAVDIPAAITTSRRSSSRASTAWLAASPLPVYQRARYDRFSARSAAGGSIPPAFGLRLLIPLP